MIATFRLFYNLLLEYSVNTHLHIIEIFQFACHEHDLQAQQMLETPDVSVTVTK